MPDIQEKVYYDLDSFIMCHLELISKVISFNDAVWFHVVYGLIEDVVEFWHQ